MVRFSGVVSAEPLDDINTTERKREILNKKNAFDKLNKFILKHRFLVKIIAISLRIAIIVALIVLIMMVTGDQIQSMLSNSEFVVVLASILGAVVGGIITYYINTKTMLQSNHMKSSIINRKVIYEPLLMEYKSILERLLEDETLYFTYDPNYRTIGSTPFEVWGRIKNDARVYQMPDFYRKECLQVEERIKSYTESKENIVNKAYEIFEFLLNSKGYSIEKNTHGIMSFIDVDDILKGKNIIKENLLKERIVGIPIIEEKDKEFIIDEFKSKLIESKVIDLFNKSRLELITTIKEAIDTTERIIIRIATAYEKKNNII